MASTVRSKLRRDLMPMLHQFFIVDTATTGTIEPGDLIEFNLTTHKVRLLEDDQVTGGYAWVGISNSHWDSAMIDANLKTTIEVIGVAVVDAPLTSGIYVPYTAVQYDAGADDGHLTSWDTGNTVIGWIWECGTGTITSAKVLIDIYNPTGGVLEIYS